MAHLRAEDPEPLRSPRQSPSPPRPASPSLCRRKERSSPRRTGTAKFPLSRREPLPLIGPWPVGGSGKLSRPSQRLGAPRGPGMDAPELEGERGEIAELQRSLSGQRAALQEILSGLLPLQEETKRVGEEIERILATGNLQFSLPGAPGPSSGPGAAPGVRLSPAACREMAGLISEYYRAAAISTSLPEAVERLERASAEVLGDSEELLGDIQAMRAPAGGGAGVGAGAPGGPGGSGGHGRPGGPGSGSLRR